MHPDIRIELARQKQAALIAAGEASRTARLAVADEPSSASRLARLAQRLRRARGDERPMRPALAGGGPSSCPESS